ncbi:AAA family ATPase [Paracoccus sp. PAR01]|uniref:ATP-binding protein n=1 Tax=Paracoccus sp. PAR01 TaxID=2769282 RepID=UPI001782F480|nr:AAA family ATPase [Paracoccus sp. PAR01]MBD9528929.1 AAA family ATPase [Paracoccus sp. PAR01]
MIQRVIAFTGISGVGKTTFLGKLADLLPFQHVTGGSLIAAARNAAPDERDTMRHADIDENQRLLIDGFALARNPKAELIIMDGHMVIDDGEGLTKISSEVFKALGVTVIVHLEADEELIARNRAKDLTRARPSYQLETLKQHQDVSRAHAKEISATLGGSFHIVEHSDVMHLAKMLGYVRPQLNQ